MFPHPVQLRGERALDDAMLEFRVAAWRGEEPTLDWIADSQAPNGPFVSTEVDGTVITIPVAAAGVSIR